MNTTTMALCALAVGVLGCSKAVGTYSGDCPVSYRQTAQTSTGAFGQRAEQVRDDRMGDTTCSLTLVEQDSSSRDAVLTLSKDGREMLRCSGSATMLDDGDRVRVFGNSLTCAISSREGLLRHPACITSFEGSFDGEAEGGTFRAEFVRFRNTGDLPQDCHVNEMTRAIEVGGVSLDKS